MMSEVVSFAVITVGVSIYVAKMIDIAYCQKPILTPSPIDNPHQSIEVGSIQSQQTTGLSSTRVRPPFSRCHQISSSKISNIDAVTNRV
jgi:hypothetical protein